MTESVELLPVTQAEVQRASDGLLNVANALREVHILGQEAIADPAYDASMLGQIAACEEARALIYRLTTSPDKQSTDIAPEPGCFCTGAGICAMHKAMGDSVVVPKVPTEAMLAAAPLYDGDTIWRSDTSADDVRRTWSAMIAAAPDANAGEA